MAKTVFFTVTEGGKSQRSQKILEVLGRLPGAQCVELAHFDPARDGEEVKDWIAVLDHNSRTDFPREWIPIGPQAPGIPEWARFAKGRAIIGPKAMAAREKTEHCARSIHKHFPVGFVAPEKGGESFIRFGKRK